MDNQQQGQQMPQETPKPKTKSSFKMIIIIGVIVVIAVGAYAGYYFYQQRIQYPDQRKCNSSNDCKGYCSPDSSEFTKGTSNPDGGVTLDTYPPPCGICPVDGDEEFSYCDCAFGYCQ